MTRTLAERVAVVSVLDDEGRRAVYDVVRRAGIPMSRDQAAAALGISRRSAAFHLDRLAEQGLLTVEFRHLTSRRGPGSGRPAKLYRRADDEVSVAVPDRRYELAAEVMAAAIEQSAETGTPARDALLRLAEEEGRRIGAEATSLTEALDDLGFESGADGSGGRLLANCPFHRLAKKHTRTVCEFNLHLLRGVAEGAGDPASVMVLDPGPDRCCVRVTRRQGA